MCVGIINFIHFLLWLVTEIEWQTQAYLTTYIVNSTSLSTYVTKAFYIQTHLHRRSIHIYIYIFLVYRFRF